MLCLCDWRFTLEQSHI